MLEKAAMHAAENSLEARDLEQAAEDLHAKKEELNISESTPPEMVLPLLIESSLASNVSGANAIDDSLIVHPRD